MSSKINENSEQKISSIPIKLKKELILNLATDISKTHRQSKVNPKERLLICKEILSNLIKDNHNITYRNKDSLNFKTKKSNKANGFININEINKKDDKLLSYKDNNSLETNNKYFIKNENIQINMDDINIFKERLNKNNHKPKSNKKEKLFNINHIGNIGNNIFNINNFNIYNNKDCNYFNYKNCQVKNNFENKIDDIKSNIFNYYISNSYYSMSEIKKKCRKKLYRFDCNIKQYYIKIINDIIMDANKHLVSIFKNYLIWDDQNEYLKRYYFSYEIEFRFKPIVSYYKEYTKFFPIYYCNLEIIQILLENIKRKTKYLKEIENNENNFSYEINSISNYFDDKEIINSNNNKINKKYNEFSPLFNNNDNLKESKFSSLNKKSLSSSCIIKQYYGKKVNNNTKVNKSPIYKNNLFYVNITPIKNKNNAEELFNGLNELKIKNSEKSNNKKDNKENEKYQQNKDNELTKQKEKIKINNENMNIANQNKDKEYFKKINLNSLKLRVSEINQNLKNKKIKIYLETDCEDIDSKNNKQNNKTILNQKNKNKETKINNRKENSLLREKNITIENNLTQRRKINIKKKKLNNITINKEFSSLFQSRNNNFKNRIINIKKHKKFNSIISNLNKNYFKNDKNLGLLKTDRRANNNPKIDFPIKVHSLSLNKKKRLINNNKSKIVLKKLNNKFLNKLKNKSNNNSFIKKIKSTERNPIKKHKKTNSVVSFLITRNNLLISSKTFQNKNKYDKKYNLKKNIINNIKRKNETSSHKKTYIKHLINIFNNINNSINVDNFPNFTNRIIKKDINTNKLKMNITKRRCKSDSPFKNKIKKKKINKKGNRNNYLIISKKIINKINNNTKKKKFDKEIINKFFKINTNKIKANNQDNKYLKEAYSPRYTTSIYNTNLNINLNNQYPNNLKDIKNNNKTPINTEKKLNVKNSIKSSKLLKIKEITKSKLKHYQKKINIKTSYNTTNPNKNSSKCSNQLNIEKTNPLNKTKLLKLKKIYISKNMIKPNNFILKNFKNNINLNSINFEFSEYLTERQTYNREAINNSTNKQNSCIKSKINNKKNFKKIYSSKNKFVLNDKSQNKQSIEDRNHKVGEPKKYIHKKSLTNTSNYYNELNLRKDINDLLNKNKYKKRNKRNNEISIKKSCKSNNNEVVLNHSINIKNILK